MLQGSEIHFCERTKASYFEISLWNTLYCSAVGLVTRHKKKAFLLFDSCNSSILRAKQMNALTAGLDLNSCMLWVSFGVTSAFVPVFQVDYTGRVQYTRNFTVVLVPWVVVVVLDVVVVVAGDADAVVAALWTPKRLKTPPITATVNVESQVFFASSSGIDGR